MSMCLGGLVISYDEMGEIVDELCKSYLAEIAALSEARTDNVSVNDLARKAWEAYRRSLAVAFEEGGWNEDDFDAEVARRVKWD